MAVTTVRDQKLLILVTADGCQLIAEHGELAGRLGPEAVHMAVGRHHEYFAIPADLGWHVWEGEIDCHPGDSGTGGNDPQGAEVAWQGEWRPATVEDLRSFGIPLPIGPATTPDPRPDATYDRPFGNVGVFGRREGPIR